MTLKDVAKRLIPAPVRRKLSAARLMSQLRALRARWKVEAAAVQPVSRTPGLKRVLIVAGDPYAVVGSVGDEAMIYASMQVARSVGPDCEIFTLTANASGDAIARAHGITPLQGWDRADLAQWVIGALRDNRIDAVVVNGADVIDGHYGPLTPAKMLCAADMAARLGIPTTVLGSSFNAHPDPALAEVFDSLHPDVRINLRDEVSLERFRSFTRAKGELVSDSAFSLAPGEIAPGVRAWIAARRAEGKQLLGFNIHPMLVPHEDPGELQKLVDAVSTAIEQVSAAGAVAWLLISHDRRPRFGDLIALRPVFDRLRATLGDDVHILGDDIPATGLKAIGGQMDGVVSGRMHLAIGSLGSGTPVLCATYQGKFEGLFGHFKLPSWLLMTPPEMMRAPLLAERLEKFVAALPQLREDVARELPKVLRLSRENYCGFDQAASGAAS